MPCLAIHKLSVVYVLYRFPWDKGRCTHSKDWQLSGSQKVQTWLTKSSLALFFILLKCQAKMGECFLLWTGSQPFLSTLHIQTHEHFNHRCTWLLKPVAQLPDWRHWIAQLLLPLSVRIFLFYFCFLLCHCFLLQRAQMCSMLMNRKEVALPFLLHAHCIRYMADWHWVSLTNPPNAANAALLFLLSRLLCSSCDFTVA